jgi:hypothetical protein
MLPVVAEQIEDHCADAVTWQEVSSLENHRRRFVRLNIFGLCISLVRLSWSEKSKLDSNAVSSC